MGASLSTLGGWTIVLCIAGYYAFRYMDGNKKRDLAKAAAQQKKRLEERYVPDKKELKAKAKRVRGESVAKDGDKSAKAKQRPASQQPLATTTNQKSVDYSSDEGVNNREFAKQLASIKQGTSFTGPKKSDEKKAKSVKQSRAQESESAPKPAKASAPSSTTGADADDDQSSNASPEFTPVDSRDVSDMLEQPTSSGPSVLRLTDTDKAAKSTTNKTAKAPEPKETKKQRQNRAKAEAAKLAREAEEAERRVKLEQQRRTARIAEGRAAKDGSLYTNAAAPKNNAWTANGTNGSNGPLASSEFVPVQPLDTFDASKSDVAKASSPSVGRSSDNWVSSLPSEEEQLSLLQDEENWNTVTSKKSKRKTKENVTSDDNSNDEESVASSVQKPQKLTPVVQQPVVTTAQQPITTQTKQSTTRPNGRPAKLGQQSSFAALSNDDDEQEEEWDV